MKNMNTAKKVSLAALMGILAAAGYGGYTVIKEKDLNALRSGAVSTYMVERVIDGDTIKLSDGDTVRLTGIDAPDEGECFYDESKAALAKLVEGKEIELRKDVTNQDDFGRLLRYAIVLSTTPLGDNTLVDEYMVKNGFATARSNPRDKLYYSLLVQRGVEADKAKAGLWKNCEMTPAEHAQKDVLPSESNCTIKGNISTGEFGKTYFTNKCNNYNQVKIDPDRGEKYFCTESAAKKEGFVKSRYCL